MQEGKYFDWGRMAALSDKDGCPYADWSDGPGRAAFAVHPGGFPVFLCPSALRAMDEYADDDPYTVESQRDTPFQQRRFDVTVDMVRRAVAGGPPAPRILDVGCGRGHITAEVRRAVPGAEVSGLDGSLSAIERAAAGYPGIDFAVADACDPPYRAAYFDGVLCNNLWEHVPDPVRLLLGVRKVLKPGGFLVISTPSRYRLRNLLRVLRGRAVVFSNARHVTEYTVGQVIEQLRFGGFRVDGIDGDPTPAAGGGLKGFIADRVFLPVLAAYLRVVKSHHALGATVFFLARKEADAAPSPGGADRTDTPIVPKMGAAPGR